VSTLNIVGGNVTISAPGSSVGVLTLNGGYTFVNYGIAAAQLNLMSGNLVGPAALSASQLYFNTQGFNLNGPVVVTSQATLGGLLSFGSSGSLTINSAATANVQQSLTFTGVPGQTVTNNGVIVVGAPLVFQNINLDGAGSANVSTSLSIQSATVSQSTVNLSGSGVFKGANTQITNIGAVTGSPSVHAVIGSYVFNCPGACDNLSTNQVPTSAFQFNIGS